MKVTLVLHDFCRGWIIEKMAHKLCAALIAAGVDARVSNTPSPSSQVNHYMIFHYVDALPGTINTVSVTHIDDALKIDMIKQQLSDGVRAMICLSRMTMDQIISAGGAPARVTFALPAHDGAVTPQRVIIGITSNCYNDNRKRDWMLRKLAEDMRLDAFEFRIFGRGWDTTVPLLEAGGAQVVVTGPTESYLDDYTAIIAAVPQFDYYFYSGLDEGSMGTIDALAAGVKTIVTLQGFHLDLPNGITHGFWDYPEMLKIFQGIAAERQARVEVGAMLTWDRYARRHLAIWSSLIAYDTLPPDDVLVEGHVRKAPHPFEVAGYGEILRNPYRRQMALRFWIPGLYGAYGKARFTLGELRRRLTGKG